MANQVTRVDPTSSVLTLRDAMDRLFEDAFIWPRGFFWTDPFRGTLGALPIDLYGSADDLVLIAALPGVKSESVNVQFQDGALMIDAEIPGPKVENVTWYYRELRSGHYHRELTLPFAVDTNKMEAVLQDGLLTLHLPKAEEAKPKKIQVKVASK